MAAKSRTAWHYPPDIAHDLDDCKHLSEALKQEAYACAWEYTRCVIPQYTNWNRYVAFMRIIIMGIIAEFKGDLVDVMAGDEILGYSLDGTLAELFEGTAGHAVMAREYKTFLLVTADKASKRRNGKLFTNYVNALATSPRTWFRMRDCDALARFTMASALACNDLDDVWLSDEQFDLLAEIGDTLYDSVAFYKHRSEGETNNTFAYVPHDIRVKSFRVAREVLWALDVAYIHRPEGTLLMNFVRFFGGPIHMMMNRYRFVEEGLTVGKPETESVVAQTRRNVKLWNRVDAEANQADIKTQSAKAAEEERYEAILRRSEELMFPELPTFLRRGAEQRHCERCTHRPTYGAKGMNTFGGVQLCKGCSAMWRGFVESLPERIKEVFPDIDLRTPPSESEENGPRLRDDPSTYENNYSLSNGQSSDKLDSSEDIIINGHGECGAAAATAVPHGTPVPGLV
ncbi:hypothetical protein JX265_012433 [Neoarthrinium moseri]|uniref:Uncharacterized protein n=1 Tax=Neoarthrinium moseri TaxID=1658444 RepID=A0A9P9WA47_9PEZI|nr:hypothetical protein JX265_012433 [Neoarthrinium moseri]